MDTQKNQLVEKIMEYMHIGQVISLGTLYRRFPLTPKPSIRRCLQELIKDGKIARKNEGEFTQAKN